jgi:hypothetical protein
VPWSRILTAAAVSAMGIAGWSTYFIKSGESGEKSAALDLAAAGMRAWSPSLALLLCWLGFAQGASRLLTLGAAPLELLVAAKTYMRFKIDLVNDYCGKTDVQARSLCMATPKAKVKVVGCRGEAWLLTNPTKTWEPTIANTEFISKKGNGTTFVELSEFDVVCPPPLFLSPPCNRGKGTHSSWTQVQSVTHIAVYNPGVNLGGDTRFQIWAENTNDPQGQHPGVKPLMRPGDQWFQLGTAPCSLWNSPVSTPPYWQDGSSLRFSAARVFSNPAQFSCPGTTPTRPTRRGG